MAGVRFEIVIAIDQTQRLIRIFALFASLREQLLPVVIARGRTITIARDARKRKRTIGSTVARSAFLASAPFPPKLAACGGGAACRRGRKKDTTRVRPKRDRRADSLCFALGRTDDAGL